MKNLTLLFILLTFVSCSSIIGNEKSMTETSPQIITEDVGTNNESIPEASHCFEPASEPKEKINKEQKINIENIKIESQSVTRPSPSPRPSETTDNSKTTRMMIGMGLCVMGIIIWIFNGKKQKTTV